MEHPVFDKMKKINEEWIVLLALAVLTFLICLPLLFGRGDRVRAERKGVVARKVVPVTQPKAEQPQFTSEEMYRLEREFKGFVETRWKLVDDMNDAKCAWLGVMESFLGREDSDEYKQREAKYQELMRLLEEEDGEIVRRQDKFVKDNMAFLQTERGKAMVDSLAKDSKDKTLKAMERHDEATARYRKARKEMLMKSVKEGGLK